MDLSQYISINAVLDNSGGSPVIRIIDNSAYPAGVAPTIAGNVTKLTQPDGLSVGNQDFTNPDVKWTGSGLTVAQYPLRLNTIQQFQIKGYSITYVVQAPGYSDTSITKTFYLSYKAPTILIGNNFDIFTPQLSVQDISNYAQSGLSLKSVTDVWSAVINTVNGNPQNISAVGPSFDLAFNGTYYDAQYVVTLNAIPTWTITDYPWVSVVAKASLVQTFDSETPPSLVSLLASLTFLKYQMNQAQCDCNLYPKLLARYLYAQAVYSHLRYRGCENDVAGLISYVLELQKIFNNGVTPPVDHTELPIPVYDFGCANAGSIDWNSITGKPVSIQVMWTVGQPNFPGPGENTYLDARLVGQKVVVTRNNTQDYGVSKAINDNLVVFDQSFSAGEIIFIQSIPL